MHRFHAFDRSRQQARRLGERKARADCIVNRRIGLVPELHEVPKLEIAEAIEHLAVRKDGVVHPPLGFEVLRSDLHGRNAV